MKIKSKDCRVQAGENISLKQWPSLVKPVHQSKARYKERLAEQLEAPSTLQRLHNAPNALRCC